MGSPIELILHKAKTTTTCAPFIYNWQWRGLSSNFKTYTISSSHEREAALQSIFCGTPNCKESSLVIILDFEEAVPGFKTSNCSVLPLLFDAEYYQSFEIALRNVG